MAGYREFQTGEVLTAANVNSFLMEQATMTFADAAARDAALAGVLRAGLNVYLQDTDRLQYYDGTAWQNVPNEADVDAAGGLVAVKSAIFTGTQTQSLAAGANVAVTGLSITHEVADPANKLIISANIGVAADSNGLGLCGLAVSDGTNFIGVGDAEGVRARVSSSGRTGGSSTLVSNTPSVTFVHTPGAGSKTYTVRAVGLFVVTSTVFINRTQGDGNDVGNPRGVSSLVIQEVKV